MRFFRLLLISIIFFLIIVTGISLFIPKQVTISRAVQINTSAENVMQELRDPSRWRDWYPSGNSAGLYYQNGEVKGLILDSIKQRYIIITGAQENEVKAAYVLPKRKIETGWEMVPAVGSNTVTLRWYMHFHLRWYPWEKFSSFMFERVYGPQIQQGLDNLKALAEK